MAAGGVLGIARFAVEYAYDVPTCENPIDNRPGFVKDIHFLYFSALIYAVTVIVSLVISLLTKPINPKHVSQVQVYEMYSKIGICLFLCPEVVQRKKVLNNSDFSKNF